MSEYTSKNALVFEKEFIPYEESVELKNLGFNEDCLAKWIWDECPELMIKGFKYIWTEDEIKSGKIKHWKAPTFSQTFRWFREKYNIDAWVQPFTSEKGSGELYLPDESYSYFIFKDGVFIADKIDLFDTEEAELACLRKLIEIVKNGMHRM